MRWSAISKVVCPVCAHHCRLKEGQTGRCRARKNITGSSVSINYGRLTAVALDPLENKPLARFYPGSMVLSVGSFGCNMNCAFCQNSAISNAGIDDVPTEYMPPDALASLAEELKVRGNIGVAYTYNEPMIGCEYVRDASVEVKKRGMKNVVVTNGMVTLKTLQQVLDYVDAYNIDLKCFTAEGYKKLGGDLDSVLSFIRTAAAHAHVEITTLIVPGFNDTPEEMQELSSWLASVDRKIPLHITRFFPRHRMNDRAPTDITTLRKLADIAKSRLDTVLLGNI